MDNDTISRQAAIDAIERLILPQVKGETEAEEINRVAWRCAINCAEEMIVHLPSAERRGRWIFGGEEGWPKWTCSVCGGDGRGDYTICPWCGARMVEEA